MAKDPVNVKIGENAGNIQQMDVEIARKCSGTTNKWLNSRRIIQELQNHKNCDIFEKHIEKFFPHGIF